MRALPTGLRNQAVCFYNARCKMYPAGGGGGACGVTSGLCYRGDTRCCDFNMGCVLSAKGLTTPYTPASGGQRGLCPLDLPLCLTVLSQAVCFYTAGLKCTPLAGVAGLVE